MSNEIGHKAGGRTVVQAVRIVPLVQLALVHHTDHVANGKSFQLIMRDQQCCGFGRLQDVAHFMRQAFAQVHIEVGEWLVQQQQVGPRGQCAGQSHALLLATREFMGKTPVRA